MRYLTLLLACWLVTLSALPNAWAMPSAPAACATSDCCPNPTDQPAPTHPKKCGECPIGVCNPLHGCGWCAGLPPTSDDEPSAIAAWPALRALPLPPSGHLAASGFGSGWWQPPERQG